MAEKISEMGLKMNNSAVQQDGLDGELMDPNGSTKPLTAWRCCSLALSKVPVHDENLKVIVHDAKRFIYTHGQKCGAQTLLTFFCRFLWPIENEC